MSGPQFRRITLSAVLAAVCGLTFADTALAEDLDWQHDLPAALSASKASGKPMLIQFTADWCVYCRKMKATTYADPKVKEDIQARFVPVLLDADKNPALVKQLGLRGLPATVVVASDMRILKKLNGYQKATKLQSELAQVAAPRQKVTSVSLRKPGVATLGAQPASRQKVVPAPKPKARYGFDQACLVSLLDKRELVRGQPEFVATYRGHNVCFASAEALAAFRRNPRNYWPRNNGQCQVAAASGKQVTGRPEFGVRYRGETWMFATLESMKRFVDNPKAYLTK